MRGKKNELANMANRPTLPTQTKLVAKVYAKGGVMNDYKATIEAILRKLRVDMKQLTHPPYTEDNKPMGVTRVVGKTEATASLLQLLTEARIEELETLWPEMVKDEHGEALGISIEQVMERIDELKEGIGQNE
jgi:hypothetical protein